MGGPIGNLKRVVAAATAVVMLVTLSDQPSAAGPDPEWEPPAPPGVAGAEVSSIAPQARPAFAATDSVVTHDDRPVQWPAAGQERVTLPANSAASAGVAGADGAPPPVRGGRAAAGTLPVWVGAAPRTGVDIANRQLRLEQAQARTPRAVTVRVAGRDMARATGVDGLLVSLARADGLASDATVTVEVDYSGFAHAYGGDWATRLRVAMLGACGNHPALAAVPAGGCGAVTPLPTANDYQAGRLAAQVPLSGGGFTTLAVSAAPAGGNGDYTATSLSPSGTWQVSAQTGGFSWSLPLRMVPGVGGPEPNLSLSYSSQAVDGRTANTNNQGSWIGDGWDMWPGYIERRYKSCAGDADPVGGQEPNNEAETGDRCWFSDNATMSLNGRATELIPVGGGVYRGVADDGSRIERVTDPGSGNGDNNGEYWRVTTVDGTQYFFGRHRRPAYPSDTAATGSTWTVPVYGNHPGEPCHDDEFTDSRCDQAWRWNLDYVVDPRGNTMTLFYGRESGAYMRELDPDLRTGYHRGGYLKRIEYGTREGSEHTAPAPARVVFDVADRCLPGTACDPEQAADWPDVPWDLYCPDEPCTDQLSPTFWTQKRLAQIRTQVRRDGSYHDVESWTLRHDWLDAGASEGEAVPMWLSGITRTGHVTQASGQQVSDPEIVFDPGSSPLPNRVDGPSDGKTKLNRWRVKDIFGEAGSLVGVIYSGAECTRQNLPDPHDNDKRVARGGQGEPVKQS